MHRARGFGTPLDGLQAVATLTDRSFPRHAHDQFGIGVLIEGAQRSWSGVGLVEQQAGDVIMVNPGEMHDGTTAHRAGRRWRMLYCDPAVVGAALGGTALAGGTLPPRVRDPGLAGQVLGLFAIAAGTRDGFAAEVALGEVLATAFGRHALEGAERRPRLASVARARQRLDDEPATPVTLAELAALAGVSRTRLLRGFRRETGTSPHAYLVQRRVQLARRLLQGDMPPAAVALACGFADQSHMTRAFVRQLGVTPGRYRRAAR